jgi:hypothetical protein
LKGSIKRRKRRVDKNNSLFDLNSWCLKTRYYQVRGKEGGRVEVTENIKGINECPQPMQEYSLLTRTVNVCERDGEKMERKEKEERGEDREG